MLKRSLALKMHNENDKTEAQEFLEVFEGDWSDNIGSIARQNASENRYNKKEHLPLTKDLVKLKVCC